MPDPSRSVLNTLLRVLLLVSFLLPAVPSRAQGDIGQIYITGVDPAGFTEVQVSFRPIDAHGLVPPIEAVEGHIQLFEDGQEMTALSIQPGPRLSIDLYYVIDMGYLNQYGTPGPGADYGTVREDLVRKSLLAFVEGDFFREGDRLHFYLRVNNYAGQTGDQLVRLPEVLSASDLYERTGAIDFSSAVQGVPTQGLSAVEAALADIPDTTYPGQAAIIYMGRLIERSAEGDAAVEAQKLATAAALEGVHLYTIHTDREGGAEDYPGALRILAGGGGRYIRLMNDKDNSADINAIYQQIVARAGTYVVNYQSQSAACKQDHKRRVAVVPAGAQPDTAELTETATYEVCPTEPTVDIVAPAEVVREVVGSAADWHYATVEVTATLALEYVDWPGSHPPMLAAASLTFNGQEQARQANTGDLVFDIDVSEIEASGQLPLVATITDTLGYSTVITEQLAVQVEAPPQAPAPTPVPTPPPPPAGPPTALVVGGASAGVLGVMVLAGGVLLITRRRRRIRRPASPALPKGATPTIVVGDVARNKPFATLSVVVARKEFVGKVIEIRQETLRIGRDPAKTDVQLYDVDAESTISREHCTMQRRPNGTFVITARSLTRVNDDYIPLHQDYPLQKGAKIVLGDVFNQGAELIFNDPKMTDIFGLDDSSEAAPEPVEAGAPVPPSQLDHEPAGSSTAAINIAGTLDELRQQMSRNDS